MRRFKGLAARIPLIASVVAVAAVLLPIFLADSPWPVIARDHLQERGFIESGAINLVSAIYLGYRAFDTLGETIVLLVAVSGTISILARSGEILARGYANTETPTDPGIAEEEKEVVPSFSLSREKRQSHALRTHLLEVVTAILGPIVLLFGFYVMIYGHLSPGGGFQGGVVVASGIVFLGLGNRMESSTKLTQAVVLGRIEAVAFLLLVLASVSGILLGDGFFGNPLAGLTRVPAGFIIILNAIIGLKVGAGIGFMCIAILGRER